jgi:PAS domain S-box-containing protein
MTWPELRHVPGELGGDADEYSRWLASVEGQLLEAEERYRALVETLPLATYIDRDDRATGTAWVSPQIEEITSYTPAEWTSNPNLLAEALHPDDRDDVLAAMARAKQNGEARANEYRMVRRDGSVVWVRDSAVTVVEGDRRYARGFVVDITARREAELELARQNEQLRQLDKLKDEFIALVSHELRTPLTSIRGYLELMREDEDLTGEQTHFVQTIDRNAQRLQRLVGDLLFCAQVEAGKLNLETGSVDVNALVRESLDAARPAAAAKSVELVAELGAVPEVDGDRARLAQVLDNFLSNAIKFTPRGGTVTVTTCAYPGEIDIAIADTGIGIAASEVPHLFQRFFRTERATADAIPGTGLGLAIAKAIVTAHGGRLRVASTEGVGTTFRVILPG